MPLTIVFLFCVKVCRECFKIYYTLRKTKINKDKNQGLPRWQRDALPLSYARLLKNHYRYWFLEIQAIRNYF